MLRMLPMLPLDLLPALTGLQVARALAGGHSGGLP